MPFQCERCGACCRAMKCQHLIGGDFCGIYATRPEVCRVEDMVDKYSAPGCKELMYTETKRACQFLRDLEG